MCQNTDEAVEQMQAEQELGHYNAVTSKLSDESDNRDRQDALQADRDQLEASYQALQN